MKKNRGVSLIEILVSCVIVALLVGGLGSVFVAGSRWVRNIHSRAAAEELGKLFLDPMQMHVRQSPTAVGNDGWDGANNALTSSAVGNPWNCNDAMTAPQNPLCQPGGPIDPALNRRHIGILNYETQYNIQDFNNVRKITATITWQEPQTL